MQEGNGCETGLVADTSCLARVSGQAAGSMCTAVPLGAMWATPHVGLTGMFGSRLLGLYIAPNGTMHFAASSLLLGQTFQDSRTASTSSRLAKSVMAAVVALLFLKLCLCTRSARPGRPTLGTASPRVLYTKCYFSTRCGPA